MAWTDSLVGRHASDDEHDTHWARTVPDRPWHGASTGELAILDIALAVAPGGLLAEGIAGLDPGNRVAVTTALRTLIGGEYQTSSSQVASLSESEDVTSVGEENRATRRGPTR